jgi:hypothetical protein
MLNRIFPERIDNHYRGHKFAIWVFVLITLLTVSRSLTHIFRSDGGAQSLSRIPLDTFANGGAETVVWAFAYIGLSQLLLGLLFVVVLLRYRAMIPLMYLVYLAEYFGAKGIYLMKPYVKTGSSSVGPVFLVLVFVAIIGFVLSLRGDAYSSLKGSDSL